MSRVCAMDDDLTNLLLNSTPFLDVRAPIEFARGSLPSATNLPLLDDKQRELVGICYKSSGSDAAIALGKTLLTPELLSERLQGWIAFKKDNPAGHMFCFRGGLRSQTVQQLLADAGLAIPLVAGGYKRIRQALLDTIELAAHNLDVLVLAGRTGSGKTRLLHQVSSSIDLEGLAHHRGSSFGRLLEPQPTTIAFENSLAIELLRQQQQQRLDSTSHKPVLLEDEARLIGRVALPASLKKRMEVSPAVLLEEPLDERIAVAKSDYVDKLADMYKCHYREHKSEQQSSAEAEQQGLHAFAEYHRDSLGRIRKRFGGEKTSEALRLFNKAFARHCNHAETADYDEFIAYILQSYYDPMYDYQMAGKKREILFSGDATAIVHWYEHTYMRAHQSSAMPLPAKC